MKTTESVIMSETKNLMFSMRYETLHSVQGDNLKTFARASLGKQLTKLHDNLSFNNPLSPLY